jgi:hypothetical protein
VLSCTIKRQLFAPNAKRVAFRLRLIRKVSQIGLFHSQFFLHSVRMKKKELTPEQLLSVPCPTCGAAAGQSCVLLSGGQRSESHVDRKLAAIEAIKKK